MVFSADQITPAETLIFIISIFAVIPAYVASGDDGKKVKGDRTKRMLTDRENVRYGYNNR